MRDSRLQGPPLNALPALPSSDCPPLLSGGFEGAELPPFMTWGLLCRRPAYWSCHTAQ